MKTLFASAALALLVAVGTPIALSGHAHAASGINSKSSSATSPTKNGSKTAMVKKERSEASITCSKKADAKGLHGKARQDFRRDCMKQHPTSTQ